MIEQDPELVSGYRLGEPVCPKARPTLERLDDAVRCYHDGCKHLFYDNTNSVLCPCCR